MFEASHPDENVLELYCMQKLTGPALESLEDHLLLCAQCQDSVLECDSFLHGMRRALVLPQETFAARFNLMQYFRMPTLVWAPAGVAAMACAAFLLTRSYTPTMAPVAVALTATRGGAMPAAKAGQPLDLDLDTRDLAGSGAYHVQVVDAAGKEVWTAMENVQQGHVHALMNARLSAGQYYVRVIDAQGAQREYSLRLGN